jgi:hypothetical protein
MSWILSAILKWLGSGVLDRVLAHLEARADSETTRDRVAAEVAVEHVRAELESRRAARDVLIAEQRHWLTCFTSSGTSRRCRRPSTSGRRPSLPPSSWSMAASASPASSSRERGAGDI